MTDDLRIPVLCKEVVVESPNGSQTVGMVYIPAAAPGHAGPMRLVEWLNGPDNFFPFRIRGETDPVLINKDNVMILTAYHDRDNRDYDEIGELQKRAVSLETLSGGRMEGSMVIDTPHNRHRALDVLNGGKRFVFLLDSGKEVHINKRFIVRAVEIQEA